MIKIFSKLGIEHTYLSVIKAIYDKPTANIVLNGETLKVFPLRSGTRQRGPFSSLLIQHSPASSSHSNQQEQEIESIQIDKEEAKFSFLSDDKILCIENPKDARKRKLLELIHEFSKVTRYKIKTQKLMPFYTPMKNYQKENIRK